MTRNILKPYNGIAESGYWLTIIIMISQWSGFQPVLRRSHYYISIVIRI